MKPQHIRTIEQAARRARHLRLPIGLTTLAMLAACGGTDSDTDRGAAPSSPTRLLAQAAAVTASQAKFAVAPAAVKASANDGNVPANTVDGNVSATRWAAKGAGQWIQYDLGSAVTLGAVKIAWYQGDSRKATFDLQVSTDGTEWTSLLTSRQSSGTTAALENYDVPDTLARYVRIVGHGNTVNDWNSILETELWGSTSAAATRIALGPSAATASANDGNVPGNTLDGNLTSTRWAAEGDGQWIEYDLGSARTVAYAKIAWNKGDQRKALFDLQMSSDRKTWVPLLTAQQSSGTTSGLETYDFADTTGRYFRIIGHGTDAGTWNSIWETELYEAAASGGPYTVSTSTTGSGSVTRSPNQTSYAANSSVTLTAKPAANYRFDGWAGDASGTTNPLTVTVNGAKNITANFVAVANGTYSLAVPATTGGSVTKSPNAASYAAGSVVSLTAKPLADYKFSGWGGDASGTSNPINVTMSSNKTVTANFAPATCQQVPSQIRTVFEAEGPAPYSADGCSMSFTPLSAQVTTSNGNGWRHELKVRKELRVGMTQISEQFRGDVKADLSKGSKTIVLQYHAETTATIVKVYVSDSSESGFLNSIAKDGIFDVYVRIKPAGSSTEIKKALGTIRSGDSFNLAVSDLRGKVTVSAFGQSLVSNVDDGGSSYLKFGNYLQSQDPVSGADCTPFASCYAKFGITESKVTFSNVSYSRE